jgi:DNA-cytosine methyltransferase
MNLIAAAPAGAPLSTHLCATHCLSEGRKADADLWVLEDTSSHQRRQRQAGEDRAKISIRLYSISGDSCRFAEEVSYSPGTLQLEDSTRATLVAGLLRRAGVQSGIVVATHRLGGLALLVTELNRLDVEFVIEASPQIELKSRYPAQTKDVQSPLSRLAVVEWQPIDLRAPHSKAQYLATSFGPVSLGEGEDLHCFGLSTGGIRDYRRGLLVGLTSLRPDTPLAVLARHLAWSRWVGPFARKLARQAVPMNSGLLAQNSANSKQFSLELPIRANLQIAKKFDEEHAKARATDPIHPIRLRGILSSTSPTISVVELFAGAGGMGLGFLLAGAGERRFRLLHSAEIHPVYVRTLQHNHAYATAAGICAENSIPSGAISAQDLRCSKVADELAERVTAAGGADVLIGGPPCQGFSSANRNSWSSANPNNQLVDTFLNYVVRLMPKVLLMENVQGILWTAKHDSAAEELSVAAHVAGRLKSLGYHIYAKLVDAAWYGVPQHRNRFFLLGIHSDLGYRQSDFGDWGPYPLPIFGPGTGRGYVNVRQALSDLPPIANGAVADELPYDSTVVQRNWFLTQMRAGAPEGVVWDHVASRHAEYVLERYQRIAPGGNWEDVAEMMTNYADVERTHSNIYRRLTWDDAAITIGHYRKSMIIHPEQHRGLSLREAARLQSFPDWFRFAGSAGGLGGGLTHKQQQLANAVCPLVTKAVAEYLYCL